MPENDIYAIIDQDLAVLDRLTFERYPRLYHLKEKTAILVHLKGILEHMRSYSFPAWPKNNPRFFIFAQNYCAQWCKSALGIGGSPRTWQSHKIFLYDLGLLKLFSIVGPRPDDAILNRAWTEAQRKHFRSITFWSVPEYTDEILERAEAVAAIYKEQNANLSRLRKNDIIRIRGSERANQLYKCDVRRIISIEETTVEEMIRNVTGQLIRKFGYTTVDQIKDGVDALASERFGFALPKKDSEDLDLSDPDSIPSMTPEQQKYERVLQNLLMQKRMLFQRKGFRFGPVRSQDRARFHIPDDVTCWVVTQQDDV